MSKCDFLVLRRLLLKPEQKKLDDRLRNFAETV